MGIPVLIVGRSGSGKSTSLRNCQDFAVFNVIGKPLPFRNPPKTLDTDDYNKIIKGLSRCKAKSIVIDDAGYLMTNQFMRGHATTGAGKQIYDFYNSVADQFWSLLEEAKSLPSDKIVYFIMHTDTDDSGNMKPKTIGKLLDEKVCIEGMCTVVLRSVYDNGKYLFLTNKEDDTSIEKSPIGMFEETSIDNDLKMVDNTIREYFNITETEEETENAEA